MIRVNRWTCMLATGATGTAICLSVLAGWQRGGSMAERLVWVALGIVLVASAHLLPALIRESSIVMRAVGGVLWFACMATACYGHATFFLLAQRHAGELRSAVIPVSALASAGRNLTVVMRERAEVTARLATANAQHCTGNCTTLEARRVTLAAKLDALDAEADDIRRGQVADDRTMTQHDAQATDPVTGRLAALLDTTVARVDLLSGLTFAAVLEGVSCLLWTVALQPRPALGAAAVVPPVTASHEADDSHAQDNDPVTPLPDGASSDPDVTQLVRDVAAGRTPSNRCRHPPSPGLFSSPRDCPAPSTRLPPDGISRAFARRCPFLLPSHLTYPHPARRRPLLVPIQENHMTDHTVPALPAFSRPRLPLGRLLATPAAFDALRAAGVSIFALVNRHARGDWGDVSDEDRQHNDLAAIAGQRVLSSYPLPDGQKVWIITEWDRSATTVLLPDDY